jgi:prepilin-type N-terminal cleavage/methylation domain-containing protein
MHIAQHITHARTLGFTLSELMIAVALMALIATFTLPKVFVKTTEEQKKAVGTEVITSLHNALYQGWQEDMLNQSSTYQQVGDYLAGKLNITRDCPVGRPAGECVTGHPEFGTGYRVFVLPNGAWVSLSAVNWGGWSNYKLLVDYNGSKSPNIGSFSGSTADICDVATLWFNPSAQQVTALPARHGDNFFAGSLVPDRESNRHLIYNYWFGLN